MFIALFSIRSGLPDILEMLNKHTPDAFLHYKVRVPVPSTRRKRCEGGTPLKELALCLERPNGYGKPIRQGEKGPTLEVIMWVEMTCVLIKFPSEGCSSPTRIPWLAHFSACWLDSRRPSSTFLSLRIFSGHWDCFALLPRPEAPGNNVAPPTSGADLCQWLKGVGT